MGFGGVKYIIPGLTIEGERKSSKRFIKNPILLTKGQVLDFLDSIKDENRRIIEAKDKDISDLVHDLRALSSAIYNSAELALTSFQYGDSADTQRRIETVLATHTMLSIRIDLLDYTTSQDILSRPDRVPVFKKIDKVVRCFRARPERVAWSGRG